MGLQNKLGSGALENTFIGIEIHIFSFNFRGSPDIKPTPTPYKNLTPVCHRSRWQRFHGTHLPFGHRLRAGAWLVFSVFRGSLRFSAPRLMIIFSRHKQLGQFSKEPIMPSCWAELHCSVQTKDNTYFYINFKHCLLEERINFAFLLGSGEMSHSLLLFRNTIFFF